MTIETDQLYSKIIEIAQDYLGPAASRFIDRQISNHLSKSPEAITPNDLPTLINWAKIGMSVLTDDQATVKEFVNRLEALKSA